MQHTGCCLQVSLNSYSSWNQTQHQQLKQISILQQPPPGGWAAHSMRRQPIMQQAPCAAAARKGGSTRPCVFGQGSFCVPCPPLWVRVRPTPGPRPGGRRYSSSICRSHTTPGRGVLSWRMRGGCCASPRLGWRQGEHGNGAEFVKQTVCYGILQRSHSALPEQVWLLHVADDSFWSSTVTKCLRPSAVEHKAPPPTTNTHTTHACSAVC